MEVLVAADASIIGSDGLDTAAATLATIYTFDIDITDTPRRQLYVALQLQQGSGTVETPTWSDVSINGEALTFIERFSFADGSRFVYTDIWGLAGSDVPVGTALTISAQRSASTVSMRAQLGAVAIGNTGATLATAAAVAQQTSATDAGTYAFNVTTSVAKRLVLAFVGGSYTNNGLTTTTFTDNSSGWDISLDPWISAKIARTTLATGWLGALTRAIATASTVSIGWLRGSDGATGGNQRYGVLTTIDLPGDNS
jgi:hypothetical protein